MKTTLKRILAGCSLVGILLTCMGTELGVRHFDSDKFLGDLFREKGFSGHPFTDEEYLRPRLWPVKAAVCLIFDDGHEPFMEYVVPLSDSIYNGLGAYSDYEGIRIRAVTAVYFKGMGTGALMSIDDLRSLNTRQQDFEIAGHGDDEERLGRVGMSNSGKVEYDGETPMSYTFAEKVISAAQDSCTSWGIYPVRSWAYGNWRMMHGTLPALFRKYGVYQAKGNTVPPGLLHSQVVNNDLTGQACNDVEYPRAALGRGGVSRWQGFQRLGHMQNDYDIGSRGSWNRGAGGSDPLGTTDSLTAWTDAVVQLQEMGVATFHQVEPAGGQDEDLDIEYDELIAFFVHLANRIQEGVLETVTLEQLAARMRGIRDGNLLPHEGFRLLTDGVATTLRDANGNAITEPICWPPHIDFYTSVADSFADPAGAAVQVKVYDLGASDTLSACFQDRDGDLDSLSYAAADTSRNVLLIQGGTANSNGLCIPIIVTGVHAKKIKISLQATVVNDVVPANMDSYISVKIVQFEELWQDNVNYGSNGYEQMAQIVERRNVDADWASWDYDRQRVQPVGCTWGSDTTSTDWHPGTTEEKWNAWMNRDRMRSYIMHDRTAAWDLMAPFANVRDLNTAANAASSHYLQWYELDHRCRMNEWVWYVDVDERTDYVYVYLGMERFNFSYTAAPEILYATLEAYPVR